MGSKCVVSRTHLDLMLFRTALICDPLPLVKPNSIATCVQQCALATASLMFSSDKLANLCEIVNFFLINQSYNIAYRFVGPRGGTRTHDIRLVRATFLPLNYSQKRRLSRIKQEISLLISQRGGTRTPEKRAPKARAIATMRLADIEASLLLFSVGRLSRLAAFNPYGGTAH